MPHDPCEVVTKPLERNPSKEKPWLLPPNIYNVNIIPFESRAGLGGAYWRKLSKPKAEAVPRKKPNYRLYELPRETEKWDIKCHRYKGVFLSNARERKATARCMISNPLTCYKDPNFPAPNFYHVKERITEYKKPALLNPHVYYRNSIVPLKKNSIHPAHTSFSPGPGRYETRYRNICPCSAKLIYQPELQLLIDSAKSLKFRRLPYTKIKSRLYCSPDWRHVKGAGHSHVFRGAKPYRNTIKASTSAEKQRNANLYADFKYIATITNTPNDLGSIRKEPLPQLPPRIAFNSTIKVITRKQLRFNKKIAFSSGLERWKDAERPLALTARQLEELKERLPMERQLRDHPIMSKGKSEIDVRLTETPKHMMSNYVPQLRKRLFKFLPLPEAKVLVTDADTRPAMAAYHGYYCQHLDAKDFFKKDVQ